MLARPRILALVVVSVIAVLTLLFALIGTSPEETHEHGEAGEDHALHDEDVQPREVAIGLFIVSISEIDTAAEAFELEAFLDLDWHDERLAFDPAEAEADPQVFSGEAAQETINEIWWPES